jgi:hypothetical protein
VLSWWMVVGGVEGGDGERKVGKIGGKNFGEERMAEAFLSWFLILFYFLVFFFKKEF